MSHATLLLRRSAAPGPWFWGLMSALALALAWALAVVCLEQVERAETRRASQRIEEVVVVHCLDQMGSLTMARCRRNFAVAR